MSGALSPRGDMEERVRVLAEYFHYKCSEISAIECEYYRRRNPSEFSWRAILPMASSSRLLEKLGRLFDEITRGEFFHFLAFFSFMTTATREDLIQAVLYLYQTKTFLQFTGDDMDELTNDLRDKKSNEMLLDNLETVLSQIQTITHYELHQILLTGYTPLFTPLLLSIRRLGESYLGPTRYSDFITRFARFREIEAYYARNCAFPAVSFCDMVLRTIRGEDKDPYAYDFTISQVGYAMKSISEFASDVAHRRYVAEELRRTQVPSAMLTTKPSLLSNDVRRIKMGTMPFSWGTRTASSYSLGNMVTPTLDPVVPLVEDSDADVGEVAAAIETNEQLETIMSDPESHPSLPSMPDFSATVKATSPPREGGECGPASAGMTVTTTTAVRPPAFSPHSCLRSGDSQTSDPSAQSTVQTSVDSRQHHPPTLLSLLPLESASSVPPVAAGPSADVSVNGTLVTESAVPAACVAGSEGPPELILEPRTDSDSMAVGGPPPTPTPAPLFVKPPRSLVEPIDRDPGAFAPRALPTQGSSEASSTLPPIPRLASVQAVPLAASSPQSPSIRMRKPTPSRQLMSAMGRMVMMSSTGVGAAPAAGPTPPSSAGASLPLTSASSPESSTTNQQTKRPATLGRGPCDASALSQLGAFLQQMTISDVCILKSITPTVEANVNRRRTNSYARMKMSIRASSNA